MRKPRLDAFDPKLKPRQPDPIDLTGITPLATQQEVYSALSREINASERPDSTVTGAPEAEVQVEPTLLLKRVRKAVKEFGKEAATHRFTSAEKQAIARLVFTYRGQGIRTSENELTRIAINFLIYDYETNGQLSILHRCLLALNE